MSYQVDTRFLGTTVEWSLSGPWTAYWMLFLRLVTGWWFFHSGLDKFVAEEPFDATGWLLGPASESILAPVTTWFGQNAAWFVNFTIPAGELLIGLALLVGAVLRLAAFFGAFLMTFFYFGNADWEHGFVNGDLMGLLLFVTVIVFAAGRVWGLDAYLEDTATVRNNPWLRYLLG